MEGRLVLHAGPVDQGNYHDANSYANNSQGQFLDGACVNDSVLPPPSNNLGVSLQSSPGEAPTLLPLWWTRATAMNRRGLGRPSAP
jgi:hypothetical protein